MAFTGNEGTFVQMSDAEVWTKDFRDSKTGSYNKGQFYGINQINTLLQQTGAKGIRVYNGLDADGKNISILVAADANEDDITDKILEKGVICPTNCGSANGLNSDR